MRVQNTSKSGFDESSGGGRDEKKIPKIGPPVPLFILRYVSTRDRLVRTPRLDGQCLEKAEGEAT